MKDIFIYVLAGVVVLLVVILAIKGRNSRRREEAGSTGAVNTMLLETINDLTLNTFDQFELLRNSVESRMSDIQKDIDHKLGATLQTGLDSSFNRIDKQLSEVYKSMGEVNAIAKGMGDIKSVFAGVKSRGVWGEVQLNKLLDDFLAPGQYRKDVRIGEDGIVEFAVCFKGEEGRQMLLPIDSKLPMDRYMRVVRNEESGDKEKLLKAKKELVAAVLGEAKKINEKYIRPPETTNFAVMFLPSESLYLEIIKLGMVEQLQSMWNIMVASPSTLCALLTSFQTGFRAIAIKEHSTEIFNLLDSVKSEFEKLIIEIEKAERSVGIAQSHIGALRRDTGKMYDKLERISNIGCDDTKEA